MERQPDAQLRPPIRAAAALLGLAALSYCAASAIHLGLAIPLGFVTVTDPFPGAAIPEAILGLTTAGGVAALLVPNRPRLGIAVATAGFAATLTLYGLSITARIARMQDVAYHLAILTLLAVALALMLHRWGSRDTTDRMSPKTGA